jgi:hypothetical protein
MSNKWICWEVEVAWKEMDMSGGDNVDGPRWTRRWLDMTSKLAVDGPRWTGRWLDMTSKLAVVAHTDALASAAAVSLFSHISKASVQGVTKLCDVAAVVQISRESL